MPFPHFSPFRFIEFLCSIQNEIFYASGISVCQVVYVRINHSLLLQSLPALYRVRLGTKQIGGPHPCFSEVVTYLLELKKNIRYITIFLIFQLPDKRVILKSYLGLLKNNGIMMRG